MFTAEGRISVIFNKVFNESNLVEFEVNKLFISSKLLHKNRLQTNNTDILLKGMKTRVLE
jgi:hypothetical protein